MQYAIETNELTRFYGDIAAVQGLTRRVPGTVAVRPADWAFTLGSGVFALLCTAYFANSFEKVSASRQSGLPGFLVGLLGVVGLASLEHDLGLGGVVGLGLVLLGFVGWCAWRLYRRRGVGARSVDERVRGNARGSDLLWLPAAQLLLVLAPLAALLESNLTASLAPYLGVTRSVAFLGSAALIGAAGLPWTLSEVRSRGLRGPTAAAVIALNLSGVGIPLWRIARSKGPTVGCRSCGHLRIAALATCPRCGEREVQAPRSRSRRRAQPPNTPWPVFLVAIAGTQLLLLTTGGMRVGRELTLRVQTPDVEISIDDEWRADGKLQRLSFGRRIGFPTGMISAGDSHFVDFDGEAKESPVTVDELARGALAKANRNPDRSHWWDAGRPAADEYLWEFFHPGDRIHVRYRGIEGRVESVVVRERLVDYKATLELDFRVRFPAAEEATASFVREASLGSPRQKTLDRAVFWSGVVIEGIFEARSMQPPGIRGLTRDEQRADVKARLREWRETWGRVRSALEDLAERRFTEDAGAASDVADSVWAEMSARYALGLDSGSAHVGSPLPVGPLYCQVLWLSRRPDAFRQRILAEIASGNPMASVVAGMTGDATFYDACKREFRGLVRGPTGFDPQEKRIQIATAWALLSLDRDAACEDLLRSMDAAPDVSLLVLLGFSGSPKVHEHLLALRSQLEEDPASALLPTSVEMWLALLKSALSHLELGFRPSEYWYL